MGTTKIIIIITIKKKEKPAALKMKGTSIYQHTESRVPNELLNSNQIIYPFLTQPHLSDIWYPRKAWGAFLKRWIKIFKDLDSHRE